VHWGHIDTEGLFMGVFVGGLCGWNLVAAYANASIGTRNGLVSRKKSPELFWIVTAICAFVFGITGVGVFLIGLGAPTFPAFVLGAATAVAAIVAIARRP
jgi:hypothetical protein